MAKWEINPWVEFQNMRDEILRFLEDKRDLISTSSVHVLWKPKADVYETLDALVIEVELPGISEEKIELEVKGREVRIYGERRLEKDVQGTEYHLLERSYGPFARKFILPDYVNVSQSRARFKNGVLIVTFPKLQQSAQPIKITVNEE